MIEYSSSGILDLITEQTKITLKDEFNTQIKSTKKGQIDSVLLNDYASLIYMNGPVSYIIIMGFENSALKYMSNILMGEEDEGEEDEEAMLCAGIASEMTNTFLGLSISQFPDGGKGVEITPPIIVDNILDIGEYKNNNINNIEIETQVGKISINVIEANKRIKE